MSSGLQIRVAKYLFGKDVPQNGVIANIYALDPEKYANSKRNVVIPVGFGGSYKKVELEPGNYLVEAIMPSGDIITQEAEASEGQWPEIVLEGEHSAHEWHSWPNLLGNVQSQSGYSSLVEQTPRSYDVSGAATYKVFLLREPPPLQRGNGIWSLSDEMRLELRVWVITRGPGQKVQPNERDDRTQLYSFSMDYNGDRTELPRWYAIVSTARASRLLTIPSPWFYGDDEVPTELLITRSIDLSIATSWVVQDPTMGTVLGYLSNGAFQVARSVANQDQALQLLFDKFQNPLGAAAGGYILLGTMKSGEGREDWYHWIENLMKYFKWLPDGAIQYAWLKIKQGNLGKNRDEVREALFQAYDRGLPYYSLGLQWLVDGLTLLGDDDQEASERLKKVQRISWCADMSSLFTALNLG